MDSEISLVFDLGSYAVKAGFAGDKEPRAVVPSVVGTPKVSKDHLDLPVSEVCVCV